MDSLNGYTIEEVKKEISKQVKYDVSDIRLFGSRITGGWEEKSDLDVVIRDVNKVDYGIFYGNYLGINCEIRFVEDFEISWLRDSV
jgi:predicted nucleotidyltransferase